MIFVICGPGGVGKGTLAGLIVASEPGLWLSRSWTTRARRAGEGDDAYRFATREEFMDGVARGGFLEWVEYGGNLYGTPLPAPPPGADVVLEIDVRGAQLVRDSHPDAVVVLVVAPSEEAQRARLHGRGADESEVSRRVFAGPGEVQAGLDIADHVVRNDELGRALGELKAIIRSHRRGRGRSAEQRGGAEQSS